jgi:hypothetical protein
MKAMPTGDDRFGACDDDKTLATTPADEALRLLSANACAIAKS